MKKRLIVWLVIFIFSLGLVLAEEVKINFYSPDKQDFTGYLLTLKLGEAVDKGVLTGTEYSLKLGEGSYVVEAVLDSLSTPTPDYFGTEELVADEGTKDFLVFPIGNLQGSVLDTEGNLVPGAELSFNCLSSVVVGFPRKTDSTGFLTIPNIPIGQCTLVASTTKEAGKAEFEIKRGEATVIEVVLEKEIVKTAFPLSLLGVLGLLVLAFLGGLFWFLYKKGIFGKLGKKKVKPAKGRLTGAGEGAEAKEREPERGKERSREEGKEVGKDGEGMSRQTQALLKTLSGKEKKVVEFLMENNNKSSQARIRYGVGLPRTSLSRVLQALEGKKIVEIEKMGKMVSVRLTRFFLGEE